jgi:hypothetical protein
VLISSGSEWAKLMTRAVTFAGTSCAKSVPESEPERAKLNTWCLKFKISKVRALCATLHFPNPALALSYGLCSRNCVERFIASVATPLNITVHLRHNLKMPIGQGSEASLDHFNAPPAGNMVMNRASLSSVYEWLERYELRPSIHVAVGAPLLVFHGMLARDVLPELGNASMIMMASPGVDQGGLWSEHGLLTNANDAEQAIMRGLLAALRPGALVVLDATFPDRDAEYEDVRALRRLMDMKSGEGV